MLVWVTRHEPHVRCIVSMSCMLTQVCDAASTFMDGLQDTMRQVEKPWTLPDALDSKVRNMLDVTGEGEDTARDPLDGLDRDMTAQDALRVCFSACQKLA